MIEFLLTMTPFSWWIIILFCIVYFILPSLRKMEFNNPNYKELTTQVDLGADSQAKFDNDEYYSLCLELIKMWQWDVKMKLDISFQTSGLSLINQYIISKFKGNELDWIKQLLNEDLSFEEKKANALFFNLAHYQTLTHTIKQDIHDDSI